MKTNPKRIPRTEADCRKAFEAGVNAGVFNASAIFLTVMLDKFGMAARLQEIWGEVTKLSEEVGERRVSIADLKCVLLEEYGIRI